MPFIAHGDGVRLRVRLQPKASRNLIDGIEELSDGSQRLRARVTAAPEKGKANKALLKLLAGQFAISISQMHVASGAASRNKTILIEGDGTALSATLARWRDEFENGAKP